jgi:hypothetical protein
VNRGSFRLWRRPLTGRETRLILYLAIVGALAAWKFLPRHWKPSLTLETAHYGISSASTKAQTEQIGGVVEELYFAYSNQFNRIEGFTHEHSRLKMKLFKDRDEFRRVNPAMGWAEAFYRAPYCQAYYSASEINPYHWMLHEAVHQLNEEVAHVRLAKWLEEGLADYFASSRFLRGKLALGRIDPNTYPVWWMDEIATTPDLAANLRNSSVIPLRVIISGSGGPRMSRNFNLYYLHWWTLTHFIFESPKYRAGALALLKTQGGVHDFEQKIGPIDGVQSEWHAHVRAIKAALAGHDLNFFRNGELPALTNRMVVPPRQDRAVGQDR